MGGSSTRIRERSHISLLLGACLALMFAGIWTTDSATLDLLQPPGNYLSMRTISLLAYLIIFALSGTITKPRGTTAADEHATRKRLALFVGGGCGLFALGAVGVLDARSAAGTALALIPLALTKCIGPCLSIALLMLFAAALNHRAATNATALGMACAFMFEPAAKAVAAGAGWGPEALLSLGTACLIGSGACTLMVLLRPAATASDAADKATGAYAYGLNLTKNTPHAKPLNELLSKRVIVGIVGTVMMLGFLRAGGSPGATVEVLPAAVVLIAAALAAWRFPSLDSRELYRAALVCIAAGFLLGPALSLVVPDAVSLLIGVGTTLFEIIIWIASVSIVQASNNRPKAATATRLVAVMGHLLGTLIAAAALAAVDVFPQAQEAASLAIIFFYMLMLLYFWNGSMRQSPVEALPPRRQEAAVPAAPLPDAEYWKRPCTALATRCDLTPRETEVLIQLAQGRDLAFMEDFFVLSRNTVKMHIRRVYAKLNVHSKQELIDLVDAERMHG